jgi:hypothetical protein
MNLYDKAWLPCLVVSLAFIPSLDIKCYGGEGYWNITFGAHIFVASLSLGLYYILRSLEVRNFHPLSCFAIIYSIIYIWLMNGFSTTCPLFHISSSSSFLLVSCMFPLTIVSGYKAWFPSIHYTNNNTSNNTSSSIRDSGINSINDLPIKPLNRNSSWSTNNDDSDIGLKTPTY